MLLFFDPIALMAAILGYILMFILAAYVAPKVASKFAGRFSLYTSMILLAALIIFSFSGVLLLIFYALNYYANWGIVDFTSLAINIVIFVIVSNLLIYIFSPLLINLMYGVKEDEKLQKIVNEVAKKLNYKGKLKAVITQNFTLPNAFAYGNFIFGKYVAVSPGMINLVDEDELKAVVGHEIGHHMHKDNAIMLLFGLLPSIIYFLGYFLVRSSLFSSNERENRGNAVLLIVGIFAMLFSFILQVLILAFSRLREYFADFEGAKVNGKEVMQSSLAKIHYYYTANIDALQELRTSNTRALFIYAFAQALMNPFENLDEAFSEDEEEQKSKRKVKKVKVNREKIEELKNLETSPLEEFLATHPPIPKRLRFLDTLPF